MMPAYPAVMNPAPRLSVGMRGRVRQCQIIKHIFPPPSHLLLNWPSPGLMGKWQKKPFSSC